MIEFVCPFVKYIIPLNRKIKEFYNKEKSHPKGMALIYLPITNYESN